MAASTLSVKDRSYEIFRLDPVAKRLPYTLRILLENAVRHEEDGDAEALHRWDPQAEPSEEISFRPARVLLQDFTGVPAVVDLAGMRNAMADLGGDPSRVKPQLPAELVIDHSVQVDEYASARAMFRNAELEFERNRERYAFLRWGQTAFDNFKVVPPNTGIVHQVNLEFLARVIETRDGQAFPDTLVGTDSHTTMINGLGVLGWGVGGIEAEAAMLGEAVSMLVPRVVGFKLTGAMREGATATDLVLTVTQLLRAAGVVGKFVEYFGHGLVGLPLADRATIGNMSPEYGATCGFFPVDDDTLKYLADTGRPPAHLDLVAAYSKAQGMYRIKSTPDPIFTDVLKLELSQVEPSLAGPKRPQDRVALRDVKAGFTMAMEKEFNKGGDGGKDIFDLHPSLAPSLDKNFSKAGSSKRIPVEGRQHDLGHGDVVIAAITSCTNTSNPNVMVGAGLLARKAVAKGLSVKPWVKTSLAPGSQVVAEYLDKSGLQKDLDKLGYNLVGFGCTTCIGNSGPLAPEISKTINDKDLVAAAVLSGNRNFEGRVNADVRANYLASPPLVVAYALAGSMYADLVKQPLGLDKKGKKVFLKDIWPTSREITSLIRKTINKQIFTKKYADVFKGDALWRKISVKGGLTYDWDKKSTYVQNPPYFVGMGKHPAQLADIVDARVLALLLDSITTDHISPAGSIKLDSPGGKYLTDHKVKPVDFNPYGTPRGNHEGMKRGTFPNIRLKNQVVPGVEGGVTVHY